MGCRPKLEGRLSNERLLSTAQERAQGAVCDISAHSISSPPNSRQRCRPSSGRPHPQANPRQTPTATPSDNALNSLPVRAPTHACPRLKTTTRGRRRLPLSSRGSLHPLLRGRTRMRRARTGLAEEEEEDPRACECPSNRVSFHDLLSIHLSAPPPPQRRHHPQPPLKD